MLRNDSEGLDAHSSCCTFGPLHPIIESLEEPTTIDSNDLNSENTESSNSLLELSVPAFAPSAITSLDLNHITDALDSVFLTGCMPDWLRNFNNLQILKAAKCGILVVSPWLVEMTALREIYLEHNLISTWPHFLRKLPELEYICLDGNPCLETAFCKSPSLRSLFFNWGPSKDSYKSIPRYIRGPEWPVAAAARLGSNQNVNFGCYFGGIYTLSAPTETSNEGFLTAVEPCPLQTRLMAPLSPRRTSPDSPLSLTGNSYSQHEPPDRHKIRQSKLLISIFNDIEELVCRDTSPPAAHTLRRHYVPITGNADIGITNNVGPVQDKKRTIDVNFVLWDLLKEEERYCTELRRAINDFLSTDVQSSTVASSLSTVFEWFPQLCSSHLKSIFPALRLLMCACNRKSKHSLTHVVKFLCNALVEAQGSYEWYARKLDVSENFLDMPSNCSVLYHNAELEDHVRRKLMTLGGMNAYVAIQFANSPGAGTMDYINRRRSSDLLKGKKGQSPVAEWVAKKMSKSNVKIEKHPSKYLYLPLFHVVRYERVFTILSYMDSRFDPLKTTCRELRRHVAYRRRTALIEARSKLLADKFRTIHNAFADYRWDAVLSVASRSYLEKALLEPKTADVFDVVLGEPASFVTQVFRSENQRFLRLVCCGHRIHILDEVFEQLIGTVDRDKVKVEAVRDSDTIRIVFAEVREVCQAIVEEFCAPYVLLESSTQEFVEAFICEKYML